MNLNYKYSIFVLLVLFSKQLIADQCPSSQVVKDRKISRDYEWTIDERRTLEDVLAVETLYSVRVKNNGEFIACYYSGNRGLIRLDGKPLGENCTLNTSSDNWLSTNNGELVCQEADPGLCLYEIDCAGKKLQE